MVHALRTDKDIAKDFMAIKTDMSKAYDRVEWCFLVKLLQKMGFAQLWIDWIHECISTVSYSVLLNGRAHVFLKPERGLRQGDPLSPFLFILCAEALVHKLNNSEAAGKLSGIRFSDTGPSVHHLLFADDSLLLCKASIPESVEIKHCLKLYGLASGQEINTSKSSIIFGAHVLESCKRDVKDILGIYKEGGEGSYLGLPECFSGSKRRLLNFIREKLQSRLHGWFAKSLSQGGKEILLKSIAFALPVYAMSCFRLSKDLCKKITSAMVEFWWSNCNHRKRIPWVAWRKMCRCKDEGGLGFRDIGLFNQSLLAKQAWRILYEPSVLMSQVLKSRYFPNGSFLHAREGLRPSYVWRSIIHGRELLTRCLVKSIGNGANTNVWYENWLLDSLPRPPMGLQDVDQVDTLLVANLIEQGRWNVDMVRSLFVAPDAELILKTRLAVSCEDEWIWGLSKDGRYSSQSGYKLMESLPLLEAHALPGLPPLEKALWRKLWKLPTLPKNKTFLMESVIWSISGQG